MLEKDFNREFTKKLDELGWAYKIPDPDPKAALSSAKRPFDGFSFFNGEAFFFESKLMKNKLSAFSLSSIQDHQYENLLRLKALGANTAIVLAYWVSRKEFSFVMFDPLFLYNFKENGKKSILSKELSFLKEKGKFISMREPFSLNILDYVVSVLEEK